MASNYIKKSEETWDTIAKSFDSTRRKPWKQCINFIDTLSKEDSVADIGCGNGALSFDVVKKVPKVKLLGIDLSKENIKFAKSHYNLRNLKFVHGDALKDLPNKKFDVVILSNVLELVRDAREMLRTGGGQSFTHDGAQTTESGERTTPFNCHISSCSDSLSRTNASRSLGDNTGTLTTRYPRAL